MNRLKSPTSSSSKTLCTRLKENASKIKLHFQEYLYLYGLKQRFYFDTSVFGGYFDEEFAEFT